MDYNKFINNSTNFLVDYIKNNHLKSLVIGISGGIDSTVSACICNRACKITNIPLIGRYLSTSTNDSIETSTALLVGNSFCSDFKSVNITEITDKITHELELCEGKLSKLQIGNIKARYRMIYLYNLASIHSGCVIDNDNFTEYNLGFYTIHGDQGDLNLGLHYLWKTEIYELAKHLLTSFEVLSNRTQEIDDCIQALRFSIGLTPTDGNGISKSDCDQFGLDTYEQVDDVLKTVYFRIPINPITNDLDSEYIRLIDSYNEQGVDKVMLLHQSTEYKRKPSPIIPTKEELGL